MQEKKVLLLPTIEYGIVKNLNNIFSVWKFSTSGNEKLIQKNPRVRNENYDEIFEKSVKNKTEKAFSPMLLEKV